MRLLVLSLLLPLAAGAATIKDAYSQYMVEGQFQYLTEFFTGREFMGRRLIVRTDPEVRAGQYFALELDSRLRDLPAGLTAVLEVISSAEIEATRYEFAIDTTAKPRSRTVFLGLTGEVWPERDRQPMAWRVQLVDGERVIDEWKSFLWEMP